MNLANAFAVVFLGALFAILTALFFVYTYATLHLIPKFRALSSDAAIDGEDEVGRQHRIAARVVAALVREGFPRDLALVVVWGCGKDARETFALWLWVARAGCQKAAIPDNEEDVA